MAIFYIEDAHYAAAGLVRVNFQPIPFLFGSDASLSLAFYFTVTKRFEVRQPYDR